MNLGDEIKRARLDRSLSLRVAASIIGVSHNAVARWEMGTDLPGEDNLPGVAAFLDRPIDEVRPAWEEARQSQAARRISRLNPDPSVDERIAALEGQVESLSREVRALTALIRKQKPKG